MNTENESCDRCGRDAAAVLGDEALCEDCFHKAGSCCGDDVEEE